MNEGRHRTSALIAVSVLAAPALAAAPGKTTQNTAIKAPGTKTVQAPVLKADTAKSKFLNANACMDGHHHKHMGALKTHAAPKLAVKQVTPTPKRG
jgi:hypothetical protein